MGCSWHGRAGWELGENGGGEVIWWPSLPGLLVGAWPREDGLNVPRGARRECVAMRGGHGGLRHREGCMDYGGVGSSHVGRLRCVGEKEIVSVREREGERDVNEMGERKKVRVRSRKRG